MKPSAHAIAKSAAMLASDKKAKNITVLNIRRTSDFADYLVIATAESSPQIVAVKNHIKKGLKESFGINPIGYGGNFSSPWNIIDFGCTVIHIMTPEARDRYRLESIWKERKKDRL